MKDCKIEQLTFDNLAIASRFAVSMVDNANFTHFTHHTPLDMIGDEWEVYMAIVDGAVIGWGQIEKFPYNKRKEHICQVGFAVLPEKQGLGYGGLLFDYVVFDKCVKYRKIEATVFQDNLIMYGMFSRRGFHVEGCFVGEERHGDYYRNVLSLAKFNEDVNPTFCDTCGKKTCGNKFCSAYCSEFTNLD